MANTALAAILRRLRILTEPHGGESTDRRLLERFASTRDEAAFAELVRRHGPMVLGVCRRLTRDAHDAEDAFQAAFLVLARGPSVVRWGESLGGWLYGVARRVALKTRASAARRLEPVRPAGSGATDPAEEAAARELRAVVDEELNGLPALDRAAVVLCDVEGRTHGEAARELGCPRGSVAKRLLQARGRLRARLLRRGIGAAAVAAGAAGELTAAVSAALNGAAAAAAGGAAPAAVAALAKGVTPMATWVRAAMAALALTVMTAGAGVGLFAYQAAAARRNQTAATPADVAGDKAEAPAPSERRSEPVRVGGVDFEATAPDRPVRVPRAGGSCDLDIGLRITNATDAPLAFYDAMTLTVRHPDAPKVSDAWQFNHDQVRRPALVTLAPGESHAIHAGARLEQPDFGVRGLRLDVPGFRLVGPNPLGGDSVSDGLPPGRWLLTVEYQSLPKPEGVKVGYWEGTATTAAVEFEIQAEEKADGRSKDKGGVEPASEYTYPGAERLGSAFDGPGIYAARYATADGPAKVADWYREKLCPGVGSEGVAFNPGNRPGIRIAVLDDSRQPGSKDGEEGEARPCPVVLLERKTADAVVTVAVSRGEGEKATHMAVIIVDNKAE